MNVLTGSPFGVALTVLLLAMCFALTIMIEGSRGSPRDRRILLGGTTVVLVFWVVVLAARFGTAL